MYLLSTKKEHKLSELDPGILCGGGDLKKLETKMTSASVGCAQN